MKNGNKLFILVLLLLGLITSCCSKNDNVEITLERFSIKNDVLKECLSRIASNVEFDKSDKVISVSLDMVESRKFYNITIESKASLSEDNIIWNNKRIVGYSCFDNLTIILLSNVPNHHDFIDSFSEDVELGNEVQTFDYIYYPGHRYRFGNDVKSWKMKAHLYEPLTFVCWQDSMNNIKFILTNSPSDYMCNSDSLNSAAHDIKSLDK